MKIVKPTDAEIEAMRKKATDIMFADPMPSLDDFAYASAAYKTVRWMLEGGDDPFDQVGSI